jgi:hypothetical protein
VNTFRTFRSFATALVLLLLPTLALAEVSVVVNPANGAYVRTFYLTRGSGASKRVWAQVRPYVRQDHLLNPLGDLQGDLAPFIRQHPATRQPWVVWPLNNGNLKQIAFSTWDGQKWTVPEAVSPLSAPVPYDDLEPYLDFDAAGAPYLVWSRREPTARVFFSTLRNGRWTPAMPISPKAIDARNPTLGFRGTQAVITYQTPTGPESAIFESATLLESAANLMDSPIPPLNGPEGGSGSGGCDPPLQKRR